MREVIDKLGYSTHSGSNSKTVKNRINMYNISTEHFSWKTPIKRDFEEIFVKNSLVNQTTLRRQYKKIKNIIYRCSICNLEPFWMNKELTLILDHINGENHDNRLENLRWVCPNCNQQLDTTTGGNKKVLKKKNYCIDCQKEISLKGIRCNKCKNKHKIISNIKEMKINRDELKNMIRMFTFTYIGNKYNVTYNAVKKWCDKYNLPRTKREIKKYTEDEWEKI